MSFALGSSNSARGMRSTFRAIDEALTRWGVDEVSFSPPGPAAKLRPGPTTSTFTSDDLD